MGLDQYAYAAAKADSWDNSRQIAYWRKHPNLQGWMEQLWMIKNPGHDFNQQDNSWGSDFNGVELELTWDDLNQLEQDIQSGKMASLETTGFFFGQASDDYYKEQDLEFVRKAKAELFVGLKVFYNSSW